MLSRYLLGVVLPVLLLASWVAADDTFHRYEGNVLPFDEAAGWLPSDPCEPPCTTSIENGHFVLRWPSLGDRNGYFLTIARDPSPPPPSLWVEWRFRSNHPFNGISSGCDAGLVVSYSHTFEAMDMNGDAAFSQSGDDALLGLELGEFHTFRYESPDGFTFRISVDGRVFIETTENQTIIHHFIDIQGANDCVADHVNGKINEWDYVRYGTIDLGEQVVATDPPAGVLSADLFPALERFTVTFDAANYVYIDDITVSVTSGPIPVVTKTRRRETDEPDTVEIVLDRPLSAGETTTFTLTDGVATNVVAYTLDFDDDGDGVLNTVDNCPSHANPDQADCDNDGTGDVCTIAECTGDPTCADCDVNQQPDGCDPDDDADGTINACDACPIDPTKVSPGQCGCGTPDTDTDLDTIPDCNDQCPGEDDLLDRNTNGQPDCLEDIEIPTLSTWGIITLALLLIAVARIKFGMPGALGGSKHAVD